MNFEEISKLNKMKMIGAVSIIICALIPLCCFALYFMGKIRFFSLWISVPISLAIFFLLGTSLFKVEKEVLNYILAQFPDWNKEKKEDKNNFRNDLFSNNVFPALLPVYNNKRDLDISDVFSRVNDSLEKSISQIEYCEGEEFTKKDRDGHRKKEYKITYDFVAGMICVKNSKNLNSITYFKTNNYPKGTKKEIIEEKSKLVLPKIENYTAADYNIDVYGDNPAVAEKLASKELFETLQNIKRELNLLYIKAVFYNKYIFFILRDKNMETGINWVFPLFISIPFFKSIDYPLLNRGVSNFKLLTDLADKAPDFTKNI